MDKRYVTFAPGAVEMALKKLDKIHKLRIEELVRHKEEMAFLDGALASAAVEFSVIQRDRTRQLAEVDP